MLLNVPQILIEISDLDSTNLRAAEARVEKNVPGGGVERRNPVLWLWHQGAPQPLNRHCGVMKVLR